MNKELNIQDEEIIGYDIIPENKEEKLTLGSVRNMIFFGLDDTSIKYDGMESEIDNNSNPLVTKLKFIQAQYLQ